MISSPHFSAPRRDATFHDAQAREIYASRFRPIAIGAVAAGVRKPSQETSGKTRGPEAVPGVLRQEHRD